MKAQDSQHKRNAWIFMSGKGKYSASYRYIAIPHEDASLDWALGATSGTTEGKEIYLREIHNYELGGENPVIYSCFWRKYIAVDDNGEPLAPEDDLRSFVRTEGVIVNGSTPPGYSISEQDWHHLTQEYDRRFWIYWNTESDKHAATNTLAEEIELVPNGIEIVRLEPEIIGSPPPPEKKRPVGTEQAVSGAYSKPHKKGCWPWSWFENLGLAEKREPVTGPQENSEHASGATHSLTFRGKSASVAIGGLFFGSALASLNQKSQTIWNKVLAGLSSIVGVSALIIAFSNRVQGVILGHLADTHLCDIANQEEKAIQTGLATS